MGIGSLLIYLSLDGIFWIGMGCYMTNDLHLSAHMGNNNLYCFYRYSDKGNPLGRTELGGTFLFTLNRRKCFNNFIDSFGINNLIVFADNANDDTVEFIKSKGVANIVRTNLGNTNGFIYLINTALSMLQPEDILMIQEDDYIYTKDAKQYVFEGIEIGDYVSLYNSLDKYKDADKGGYNPLIYGGGEDCKVLLGKTITFKTTNATTGSFAAKIKTLREDYDVIMKHCQPHFPYPQDFLLFRELITQRNRRIVVPIPGKSSHVGLELSPFVDWESIVKNLKED
jgi:hypothetical protein